MLNNAHCRAQFHDCTDEHQVTVHPHRRRFKKWQRQPAPEVSKNAGRNASCRREIMEASAASTPSRSNLDSFLECTMPTVHCQFFTKTFMGHATCTPWKGKSVQSIPFFNLGDLWDAFDEWSAYGAEVPLYLPGGQVVMQFYVPYLSAIQIYARDVSDWCATERRLAGEESEFSDLDLRDTSSEGSVDKESNILGRIVPPGVHGSDTVSNASTLSSEGSDGRFQTRKNKRGRLIFEFFERSAPSGRAPFADRLFELTRQFQKLRSLRSNEVAPASWLSVAWYPIYRIPTGATMRDLAPRFLTFHSLSTTSFEDQDSEDGGRKKGEPIIDFDAYIPAPSKIDEERIALPAFGLASYKCRGAVCSSSVGQTERRRILSLLSCADAWLKQLDVRHPDFDFFVSYGAFAKR